MRHAKNEVFVHLVWATWDRLPLLTEDIQTQAYRAIGAECDKLDVQVLALGGVADHIHLLVKLPATLSVADLAKYVKGSSGHLLARQGSMGAPFFKWQGAYATFSVSAQYIPAVCEYINHQAEHHQANTIIAEWESEHDSSSI